MKYYLDTNIIIYALKNSYPAIASHFLKINRENIVIPDIVLAEIEYGAQKSIDYNNTIAIYRKFTDTFIKQSFDTKCTKIYGKIRSELEKSGQIIGANDLMIASIVLANNGILVSHNTKEFSRIHELQIEDWTI